ncbi:MAG TPA: hypothetical protein VE263_20000 [Candidatus Angelobacter sp.]|nr:hypothetical protein [Candidatus Angelobacter sp.]
MELKTANSNPVNQSSRCQKRTRKGQCSMLVLDPSSAFCPDHARRQKQGKSSELAAELTAGLTEFKSAVSINEFLSRLLLLQAQDRIAPRRASVMSFNCALLLRTLPAIEHELNPPDAPQQIIWDLPRPKRDAPVDPERAFYASMSKYATPKDAPAGPHTFPANTEKQP